VRLAVTVGDPAGIGPEVVLRALNAAERPEIGLVVYGDARALAERARRFGLARIETLGVELVDVPAPGPVPLGQASAAGGAAAASAVQRAAQDARLRRVQGLVTAPLNKEALRLAGHPWPGHTELLAEVAGVHDVAMLFVGGGLRVALLTIHSPLREVADAITSVSVRRVVWLLQRELPAFGVERPRLALCGLNPHAGEAGLIGQEEARVLAPAAESLRAAGLDVAGPLPADSLFPRAARGEFDAVVAAYHDQGLIPVKLLAGGRAVNVTLGLPFVRTSADHGTAFGIVEQGRADPASLLAALQLAAELAAARVAGHGPALG
jgi:4-hydroxythreonine-4-phosphate dehydrogenase